MATHHRWAARAFVVALHAALLVAALLHRPPGLAPARERQATTVRLIQPQPRVQPPIADTHRITRLPPPLAPVPAISPPPYTVAADALAPPLAPPTPVTAPPGEPPRTALRLTLPPQYTASAAAQRNPALSDPRSNTPRRTLEDRIADATGGAGAWVEEPKAAQSQVIGALGEHRSVLRKGSTCVEVFRSRISDSDPFNRSVAPRTVAMMGKPYQCK